MQNLPDIVEIKGAGIPGLKAKLLKKSGKVYMYERNYGCYEVFIVRVAPEKAAFGMNYPEREVYPSNEDFGKTAWCYNKMVNAEKRYRSLVGVP